jgi:hypothetical protein
MIAFDKRHYFPNCGMHLKDQFFAHGSKGVGNFVIDKVIQ